MSVLATSRFRYVRTIGAYGVRQLGLNFPVDLAVGGDGRLYIINGSYRMFSGAPRRPGVFGEPNEGLFTRASIMTTQDDEVERHRDIGERSWLCLHAGQDRQKRRRCGNRGRKCPHHLSVSLLVEPALIRPF